MKRSTLLVARFVIVTLLAVFIILMYQSGDNTFLSPIFLLLMLFVGTFAVKVKRKFKKRQNTYRK